MVKSVVKYLLRLLPDKMYIQINYFRRMKRFPDLKNPKTFNEKMQWLKLYDRKPEYSLMVDKYEAKKYVADRIGEEYIIPTLGVWDRFEDIDFDSLPNQFVLKCTHDSGGLVICRDKSKFDKEAVRAKIDKSLRTNYYFEGREWPYKNVKPRIIAEQYMQNGAEKDLTDYKFFCFNGEPKFLYVSTGFENHATASISFLTLDWEFAPFTRSDYKPFAQIPPRPSQLNRMIEIAKNLSRGKQFLRVDLYQVQNNILFSELTFSPCGGMIPISPKEWDKKLGEMLEISK